MPYQIVNVPGAPGSLAMDGSGNLYAAYEYLGQIYVARSLDGGVNWADMAVPQIAGYDQQSPLIMFDPNGFGWLFWTGEYSDASGAQARYRRLISGSWVSSFGSLGKKSGYEQSAPKAGSDTLGNIHTVWSGADSVNPGWKRIWYGRIYGADFDSMSQMGAIAVHSADSIYDQVSPAMAVDGQNNLHVVWVARDEANPASDTIWYRKRSAAGTWGTTQTIVAGSGFERDECELIVGSDGVLHLVWREKAQSGGSLTSSYLAYQQSQDGGSTWSAKTIITSDPDLDQGNSTLCTDSYTGLHVLFQGRSSGIYDRVRRTSRKASWGGVSDLTNNALGASRYPKALSSDVNGAVRYIWQEPAAIMFSEFLVNQPPNAPVLVPKVNFDASQAAEFAWAFSDADQDDQQSAYQLQIREVGATEDVFDSGKVAGVTASHALSSGVLTNGKQYQWRVKTWDSYDVPGIFSAYSTFYASAAPVGAITYPATDGATHEAPFVTVGWSFTASDGDSQGAYQVTLTDATGTALWSSGKASSLSARSRAVDYTLAQDQSYQVWLTVWNTKGMASATAIRLFGVAYDAPIAPVISSLIAQSGYITVDVLNPAGEAPAVVSNDIYRRESSGAWLCIARGIAPDGVYDDYAVASGKTYEYKARAIAENGAVADSLALAGTLQLQGVWLHDVLDPYGTLRQFAWDEQRDFDWQPEAVLMQFAGRRLPVAEFGESEQESVTFALSLFKDDGDAAALEALIRRKGTLCYRDGRGRKVFGVIRSLSLVDQRAWGSTVSAKLEGISYSEEV